MFNAGNYGNNSININNIIQQLINNGININVVINILSQ